jgi:hypothetical protein
VQWTMAYEIRGSMLVYLVLTTTASFTPACRRAIFVTLIVYSLYYGDFLGDVPFYCGVLLADMSLVLSQRQRLSTSKQTTIDGWRRFQFVRHYWPIMLAIFGLFLSSYPPDSPYRAAWSDSIHRIWWNMHPAGDGIANLKLLLTGD